MDVNNLELTTIPENYQKVIDSFKNDLFLGIGKIGLLKVIKKYGNKGVHGWQIKKDLEGKNKSELIKERTMYSTLNKWESKGEGLSLIRSIKKKEENRPIERKYYYLTEDGREVLTILERTFNNLIGILESLDEYCKNCDSIIEYTDDQIQYCENCGTKIEGLNLEV